MMMNLFSLSILGSLSVIVTSHHFYRPYSVTQGPECFPRNAVICGDLDLLDQSSVALTDGFGPNVCRVTNTYSAKTLSYRRRNYCYFRGFCVASCLKTSNCTGPMRNLTLAKITCCDGFGIDPTDAEAVMGDSKHRIYYYRWSSKKRVLREKGCNLVLQDSVNDCLLNLNLLLFVNELVTFPDLFNRLGKVDEDEFTVFAPNKTTPEEGVEGVVGFSGDLEGHIIESEVLGKKLRGGLVLKTVNNNFIHVGRAAKSFFVNGVQITKKDACRARNGVVHIVDCPIPTSSDTIADILNSQSEFSTFRSLLDAAGITDLLNVTSGKSRTVLAPTNAAFDALPNGTIDCLLRDENENFLNKLVLIHIGAPADYSATLSQRSRFFTFTNYYLVVSVVNGTIFVTNDRIPLEQLDITASNGVIHGIPQVIIPPRSPC